MSKLQWFHEKVYLFREGMLMKPLVVFYSLQIQDMHSEFSVIEGLTIPHSQIQAVCQQSRFWHVVHFHATNQMVTTSVRPGQRVQFVHSFVKLGATRWWKGPLDDSKQSWIYISTTHEGICKRYLLKEILQGDFLSALSFLLVHPGKFTTWNDLKVTFIWKGKSPEASTILGFKVLIFPRV